MTGVRLGRTVLIGCGVLVATGCGGLFGSSDTTPSPASTAASVATTTGSTTPATPPSTAASTTVAPSTTVTSTTSGPTETTSVEPATTSEPASPASVAQAKYDVSGGVESRYSADYYAAVTEVNGDGPYLTVTLEATGEADLRRPETSCVVTTSSDGSRYISRVMDMNLSVDEAGHFVGELTFPTFVSGELAFNYSCADDYTSPPVGTLDFPSIGISRYSEDYYAIVTAASGSTVEFMVHGLDDLRAPESSCVESDGTQYPATSVENNVSPASDAYPFFIGRLGFDSPVAGGRFTYSCAGDYSTVQL